MLPLGGATHVDNTDEPPLKRTRVQKPETQKQTKPGTDEKRQITTTLTGIECESAVSLAIYMFYKLCLYEVL